MTKEHYVVVNGCGECPYAGAVTCTHPLGTTGKLDRSSCPMRNADTVLTLECPECDVVSSAPCKVCGKGVRMEERKEESIGEQARRKLHESFKLSGQATQQAVHRRCGCRACVAELEVKRLKKLWRNWEKAQRELERELLELRDDLADWQVRAEAAEDWKAKHECEETAAGALDAQAKAEEEMFEWRERANEAEARAQQAQTAAFKWERRQKQMYARCQAEASRAQKAEEGMRHMNGVAERLYQLLDDIDTMSDATKGDLQAFYDGVQKLHVERFKYATTDGYSIQWKPDAPTEPETAEQSAARVFKAAHQTTKETGRG